MNKQPEQLERVDELLDDGRKRREFEQAVIDFRKQMQRNTLLGYLQILTGFFVGTSAFFSGLVHTIEGKHVLLADGLLPLVIAISLFFSASTVLWKKPGDRILLALLEKSLREQQTTS